MAVRLRVMALLAGLSLSTAALAEIEPSLREVCTDAEDEGPPGPLIHCLRQKNAGVEKALQAVWPAVQFAVAPEERAALRRRHERWHADKLKHCARVRAGEESDGPTIALLAEAQCLYRENVDHLADFLRLMQRDVKGR